MIGLMYKDLVVAAKQMKVALFVIVFYTIFTFYTGNLLMFGYMTALFCIMLPISGMAFDEKCNWNKFALTMPVSVKQLVYSKYILSVAMEVITTILFLLLTLLMKKGFEMEQLQTAVCLISGSVIFTSLYMPCAFKLGTEKSRYVIFVLFGGISLAIIALSKLDVPVPDQATIQGIINMLPLIALFFLVVSVMFSVSFMTKKEY